ncbi:hypothetical protein [Paenibacillus sp. J2TS4]|uniref:hypothetical protein n=1 Tax=Paenibacillus sp. J2TS4 TaxID=2807194 RepID=UPI001B0E22C3|nr:hypothetical protein [Paenibacillus sp. J2TS4]GIP32106.1 hypothetical protein J2TS4_13160 [Paenibacillus sp. J2TS4]
MIDFRIQGFDILPDIIGYILFAVGFSTLAEQSSYFKKAGNLNIFMIFLSIFSIYEQPDTGGGIHFNPMGMVVGIVSLILGLVIVYYLFMGIKEMANRQEKTTIYEEAEKRWTQYLLLQVAAMVAFVMIIIPPLAIIYIVALFVFSIALTILIMRFMKRCEQYL